VGADLGRKSGVSPVPQVHSIDGLSKAVVGSTAGRELVAGTNGMQPTIKTQSQQTYADYKYEYGGYHGH
jgi:hypothetical protein